MQERNTEIIVLPRKDLYDRVWTTAMRNLAPELGVSDVGLKKICKRYSIPTPPVGYWAKREHGRVQKQPQLPAYNESGFEGIKFYTNQQKECSEITSEVEQLLAQEKTKENRIVVPSKLDEPDSLVERTLKSLIAARADEDGIVKPRAKKTLDVQVAQENVDRAMLIMDTLLKALDSRSLQVLLSESEGDWTTTVTVLDETIEFAMHEIVDRVERKPTPSEKREMDSWPSFYGNKKYYRHVLSNRLCLEIKPSHSNGRRRRFTDTKRQSVENLLNTFISTLYHTAQDNKAERKRLEELRLEREEQARKQEEWERQRFQKLEEIHTEEERVQALISEADAWHKSQSIRKYVHAARENLIEVRGKVVPNSDEEHWLQWANKQADRLDPLANSPPSVLDEKPKWDRSSYWNAYN